MLISDALAQAGTDGSLVLSYKLQEQASNTPGGDDTSSVKAPEAVPSSNLRKNDYTRPTKTQNAGENPNLLAPHKETHRCVQGLKEEGAGARAGSGISGSFNVPDTPE